MARRTGRATTPLLLRPDRRLVFLPETHLLLHHHLRPRRVLLPASPPGAARPTPDLIRVKPKKNTSDVKPEFVFPAAACGWDRSLTAPPPPRPLTGWCPSTTLVDATGARNTSVEATSTFFIPQKGTSAEARPVTVVEGLANRR